MWITIKKTATILNKFSSNNFKNPQYNETEPLSQNVGDPLMKAIMKYRPHSTINQVKEKCNLNLCFSFSQIERDEIIKEINNVKTNKATQSADIPDKLIKENSYIFTNFIFENINKLNNLPFCFSKIIKDTIITPVHKKMVNRLRIIIDL